MTVPVTLTLVSTKPTIGVNPASLSFTYYTLGSSPSPQTLTVNNAGGGTLRWTAAAQVTTPPGGSWLNINPGSGSIVVSVNGIGLAPGLYTGGTIIISDNLSTDSEGDLSPAINAPKTVNVSLNVIEGEPPASCDPSVPHITEQIRGGAWGVTGTVVGQNEKSYCIVLPDGLPRVFNEQWDRPAVPPGTPYQILLQAVDSAGEFTGNSFYVTLKKPSGEFIAEGQYLGGLTQLIRQNNPPGAYLVTLKIREFAPGAGSAGFTLGLSTVPALVPGELR
jgi:hypothetical protein